MVQVIDNGWSQSNWPAEGIARSSEALSPNTGGFIPSENYKDGTASPTRFHAYDLLPPRFPAHTSRSKRIAISDTRVPSNMAYDDQERRNMELGKKKIDALAYGFFNLPLTVNDMEVPGSSSSSRSPGALNPSRDNEPIRLVLMR